MWRHQKGFTLMELMVVIVIVAILAAVAVPLYINYVRDAQRTEAKGAIGAIITAEQVHYQRYSAFTADTTELNVDLSDLVGKWTFGVTVPDPTTSFVVQADGVAGSETENLMVKCTYTRGQAPLWEEQ